MSAQNCSTIHQGLLVTVSREECLITIYPTIGPWLGGWDMLGHDYETMAALSLAYLKCCLQIYRRLF